MWQLAVAALPRAQHDGLLLIFYWCCSSASWPSCKNKCETACTMQMKNNILCLHITFCNLRFKLCFLKFRKCCHYPHDKSGSLDNFLSLSRIFNFLGDIFVLHKVQYWNKHKHLPVYLLRGTYTYPLLCSQLEISLPFCPFPSWGAGEYSEHGRVFGTGSEALRASSAEVLALRAHSALALKVAGAECRAGPWAAALNPEFHQPPSCTGAEPSWVPLILIGASRVLE